MTVRKCQLLLDYLDYPVGAADGILGSKTAAALKEFQKDSGLPQTGACDAGTEKMLLAAVGKGESRSGDWWGKYPDFTREEFACRCGKCGGFPAEPAEKLVMLEQRVRTHFGRPARNSSGVRCKSHNAAVGGVGNSRHLTGCAVDFAVSGISAAKVLEYVKKQPETNYCYAIDGSYVHMDVAV